MWEYVDVEVVVIGFSGEDIKKYLEKWFGEVEVKNLVKYFEK